MALAEDLDLPPGPPPEDQEDLGPEGLEKLFDALHAARLRVGPRDRILAARLIAELRTRGYGDEAAPLDLRPFRPQLAPLLARSTEQREIFFRVFDALWPPNAPTETRIGARPEPPAAPPPRPRRRIWPWLGPLLALTFAAVLALVFVATSNFSARRVGSAAPAEAPAPRSTPATPATAAAAAPAPPSPRAGVDDGLVRLRTAAARFEGAPTLEELSGELARTSPIGWDKKAYLAALSETTRLPREQPIGIGAANGRGRAAFDPVVGVPADLQLAHAIDLLERPGRAPPMRAFFASPLARQPAGPAVRLADELQSRKLSPNLSSPEAAVSSVRSLTGDPSLHEVVIRRALALRPNPPAWNDAPWKTTESPRMRPAPGWAAPMAALIPFGVWIAWALRRRERRRAHLRRRAPKSSPLRTELVTKALQEHARRLPDLLLARKLQMRTIRPSTEIDIDATIRATLAAGGPFIQLRYGSARPTPDYLILIERRAVTDQEARRARALFAPLENLLHLDFYYFQSDPSWVQPEAGGAPVPLEQLMAASPYHRLVVIAGAMSLLDPMTRAPSEPAVKLMHWDRRAILTPNAAAEWALEELILSGTLKTPIGRATVEGLKALPAMLDLERREEDELLHQLGDGRAAPLPRRLLGQALTDDREPEDVAALMGELRRYLGFAGFAWLCALAVYPAVQWGLTLYLGQTLPRRSDQPGGAKIYSDEGLAALTRLPWLRVGRMPPWLRRALIAELSPKQAERVREQLGALLKGAQAMPEGAARRDSLPIARETARSDPRLVLADEVFLDFLAAGEADDLELPEAPWLRAMTRREPLTAREWTAIGLVLLYAVAAWLVTPKPAQGAPQTGAWLPLAALAGAGLLTLTLSNVRRAGDAARLALSSASPIALFLLLSAAGGLAGADVKLQAASVLPSIAWAALPALGVLVCRFALRRWIPAPFPHRLSFAIPLLAAEIGLALVLSAVLVRYPLAHLDDPRPWFWGLGGVCVGVLAGAAVLTRRQLACERRGERRREGARSGVMRAAALALAGIILVLPASLLWWGMERNSATVEGAAGRTAIVARSPQGGVAVLTEAGIRLPGVTYDRPDLVAFGACGNGAAAMTRGGEVLTTAEGPPLTQVAILPPPAMPPLVGCELPSIWLAAIETLDGEGFLQTSSGVTVAAGPPVTAFTAALGGRFLVGRADGRIGLVGVPVEPARPDLRGVRWAEGVGLVGRVRMIYRANVATEASSDPTTPYVAVGDDGSSLSILVSDQGRLTVAPGQVRPDLRLGPAVPWRAVAAITEPSPPAGSEPAKALLPPKPATRAVAPPRVDRSAAAALLLRPSKKPADETPPLANQAPPKPEPKQQEPRQQQQYQPPAREQYVPPNPAQQAAPSDKQSDPTLNVPQNPPDPDAAPGPKN